MVGPGGTLTNETKFPTIAGVRSAGEKPLECKMYGKHFNDPSRHHKHLIVTHGYKAKQRKTNYPNGPPDLAIDDQL